MDPVADDMVLVVGTTSASASAAFRADPDADFGCTSTTGAEAVGVAAGRSRREACSGLVRVTTMSDNGFDWSFCPHQPGSKSLDHDSTASARNDCLAWNCCGDGDCTTRSLPRRFRCLPVRSSRTTSAANSCREDHRHCGKEHDATLEVL